MTPTTAAMGKQFGGETPHERREQAFKLRVETAEVYRHKEIPRHSNNGDEEKYKHQNYYANFTKGLPHDVNGEVDPNAYASLLAALESGKPQDFENIVLGSASLPVAQRLLLVDPQCGLAYDLEGIDSHQLTLQPCYAFNSAGEIGEIAENYWMSICRDIPFAEYEGNPDIEGAAADLNKYAQFDGPRDPATNRVSAATLFRGLAGDLVGPYLSQFMILPVPYGAQQISQKLAFGLAETDYLVAESEYLAVQNGAKPSLTAGPLAQPHIIRNGRDLGQYVHIDELFQAYLNACLLLITPAARGGFGAPIDGGNPYVKSQTQTGFGTLGEPNFKTLVAEVATRALKAVWFEKWFVHRRLRPEEFGGRLQFHLAHGRAYEFNAPELAKLQAGPLQRVKEKNGTYLLPVAFPEGCPVHPAYGAGHATVAGACVTVLKALFKEEATLASLGITPMVPNTDGTALLPYAGTDAGQITIGSELNKLASNVAIARNFAGVHWRSDYTESIRLGEQVALDFLRDCANTYNEDFSCSITLFDGTKVTLHKIPNIKHQAHYSAS